MARRSGREWLLRNSHVFAQASWVKDVLNDTLWRTSKAAEMRSARQMVDSDPFDARRSVGRLRL